MPVRLVFRRGYLVSGPDLIAEVLTGHSEDYRKIFLLRNNRLFLGRGLLTSEGAEWRQARGILRPAFHSARIVNHAGVIAEEATRSSDQWKDGDVIDVQQSMMDVTLRVALRCLLATDAEVGFEDFSRCIHVIQKRMMERYRAVVPLPDSAWTPRNIGLRRALRTLDETVYHIISERKAAGADGQDVVSLLLRGHAGAVLPDKRVRDEVMTMLFAGHESTALTLSWCWYLLSQHTDVNEWLCAELDLALGGRPPSAADLPRLSRTGKVVKEAMRLYPPVYAFGRDTIRDTTVGGNRVPAGRSLVVAPWVVHRDPRFYPDPLAFNPIRWTPEFERGLPRFAYLPFGGGSRICLGKEFAMLEAVLVLATLAQRFRAELVPNHRVELWPTFTLRSRFGLPMRVVHRGRNRVAGNEP